MRIRVHSQVVVRNTGMDGSGTHGRGILRHFKLPAEADSPEVPLLPSKAAVVDYDIDVVKRAIRRANGGWIGASADRLRGGVRIVLRRFG